MIYVSIDLETTGLDPQIDQVLMAALVIEDTEASDIAVENLPTFACLVEHDRYEGSAFALGLNGDILKALGTSKDHIAEVRGRSLPIYPQDADPVWSSDQIVGYKGPPSWESQAATWLQEQLGPGPYNAAGKNAAGFDLQFLKDPLKKCFRHRVLDPGSVFFDDSLKCLNNLGELKQRLKIDDGTVAHDAVDDARDVIRILRKSYGRGVPL